MPQLLDFANEILYKIIDQIHPDDIVNFSLCRKEIHELAKDAVSLHLQRKKTCRDFELHGCHRDFPIDHPLELIRDICMDWRIGEYPKTLKFHCDYHFPDPGPHSANVEHLEELKSYESQRMEDDINIENTMQVIQGHIEEKFVQSGFSYPDNFDVATMCDEVRRGDRTAMLAVFLLFVPNLEELSLQNVTWDAFRLEHAILSMSAQRISRARKPFENLSVVRFHGDRVGHLFRKEANNENDAFDNAAFEFLILFAMLPSVRKIVGAFIRGDSRHTFEPQIGWKGSPRTSNVTELDIETVAVDVDLLTRLLVGLKSLKRFTWFHCDRIRPGLILSRNERGMEVHKVVAALFEHAKHSLEFVKLVGMDYASGDDDNIQHRYFQDFEVLKEVDLYIDVYIELCPDQQGTPHRHLHGKDIQPLIHIFPPSIESVSVWGRGAFKILSDIFVDFAENKRLRLPMLNNVLLRETCGPTPKDKITALTEMCEKVGVTLQMRKGD